MNDEGREAGHRKAAYTLQEFCALFGVGRTFCFKEIAEGRLRTRKAGRRTLVLAADAEAWLLSLLDGRAA